MSLRDLVYCRSEGHNYFAFLILNFAFVSMAPLARVERATPGLGNLCSIHLSYRGEYNTKPCKTKVIITTFWDGVKEDLRMGLNEPVYISGNYIDKFYSYLFVQ